MSGRVTHYENYLRICQGKTHKNFGNDLPVLLILIRKLVSSNLYTSNFLGFKFSSDLKCLPDEWESRVTQLATFK